MNFSMHLPMMATVLSVLALLCGGLWLVRRSHGMLLWLSAAWGYAALGAAVLAWLNTASGISCIVGAALACIACAHAAQALAWRFGRRIHQGAIAIGSGWVLLGSAMVAYASSPAVWHGYFIALGLAFVAGHGLPQLWRMPSRHGAERSLLLAYSVCCMLIAASPWLLQILGRAADAMVLLCVGAVAITTAMVACVRADGFALPRRTTAQPASVAIVDRATFAKSFSRQSAEQQISFLVLCDLDQFRSHHAQWGESTSTALLEQFAHLLQTSVRAADQVVRVAHDEFALALRRIDRSNAQALVERILQAMRQQPWTQSSSAGTVTASFGICMVRDTDTLEMALHRADVLLCQAKDAGGNRVAMEEGHATVAASVVSRHP